MTACFPAIRSKPRFHRLFKLVPEIPHELAPLCFDLVFELRVFVSVGFFWSIV